MGEVYRARDTRLGRLVAVKVLPDAVSHDPHRVALFETEARALAALSHPNILGIHDFGQSDGRLYTVTELLRGESLQARMSADALPWRTSAQLAASIADGLASAHAAGIVHRDLKPSNIFITSDGRVKIIDFGLAKSSEPVSEDAATLTSPSAGVLAKDGEVVGTLSYMAPEQLRGLPVDGRTDIYALGCVLFEMISGKRPFSRATRADTFAAILREEPQHLDPAAPGIPRALEAVVMRCLEKRPEDRFDTAHDLAIALRTIYSDQRPAARSPRNLRPRRRLWLATIVVLAAALAAAGVLLRLSRAATSASEVKNWGNARQITSAPGWAAEPSFSPDGTLVAYSSNASGNSDIWVVDPDGGEPLRVSDGAAEDRRPTWFPDGRFLAFVSIRSGVASVWKVSRLGGSASLLIENADMPAISPDGTRIAFSRAGASGNLRIWVAPLANPSHAERVTGDDGGPWDHINPTWSPKGTLLCYSAFSNLWLVPAGGGPARKLTRDARADREPVFSPDGSLVYFSSDRTDPPSVWRVALSGGAPERVTPGTGAANHPSLSRDGRRLVFSSLVVDRDVVVADRETGTVSRIASSRDDQTPTIAPDGSAVAYASNRLGTYDLWLEPLEAGRTGKKPPRRLTSFQTGLATPVFSPDGQWVAFFRVVNGKREIWASPVSGEAAVPLVRSSSEDIHPAYAPDGTRLAFISNRSGRDHVWILPLRVGRPGGDPWRLTDGNAADMFPVWSPDGGRLAFIRGEEVWVVDVRRGAIPHRITAGAEAHHLAWEPDGNALLVTGLFGTSALHPRRVEVRSGRTELLKPDLVLGSRDAFGYVSLSRDGRFLATDITEMKGNLWITAASRDGR
jgi:Tol biopolymer transport system component